MDLQIVGKDSIPDQIRNKAETRRGNHDRYNSQAIKTVGQVHRVGSPDNHKHTKDQKEPAKRDQYIFEKRNGNRRGKRLWCNL